MLYFAINGDISLFKIKFASGTAADKIAGKAAAFVQCLGKEILTGSKTIKIGQGEGVVAAYFEGNANLCELRHDGIHSLRRGTSRIAVFDIFTVQGNSVY